MGLFSNLMTMAAGKRDREREPQFLIVPMPENFGRTISSETSKPLCDTRSLRPHQTVIIDCSACPYIDSNAIGLLVELRNEVLKRGANVILAAPTSRVRKVIEVTRLHRVFATYPSLDEAIASCSGNCQNEMHVTA